MASKLVCICNHVTGDEILKVLKKGARTTGEIKQITTAGTSCGRCIEAINVIVETYKIGIFANRIML